MRTVRAPSNGFAAGTDALLALDPEEIGGEGIEEGGLDHPLQDCVSVALHAGDVRLDICRGEQGAPRGGGAPYHGERETSRSALRDPRHGATRVTKEGPVAPWPKLKVAALLR